MGAKLIDDKPAIALLGPASQNGQSEIAATLASSLASSGYVVIVSGPGHTATIAARAGEGFCHDGPIATRDLDWLLG